MQVIFMDGLDHAPDEIAAYRDHAMRTHIDFDGDEAVLDYEMPRVPFERIRRYLVGTTDRWKLADRVDVVEV